MITLEFLLTTLVVVLIPGTGVIYTLSAGLFLGPRAALMATIGCTIGIVPQLLGSVLGLATLLHMSSVAFQLLKFVGVAYLLYLAWCTWRDTGAMSLQNKASKLSDSQLIWRAFLINVLNPKLSLFFLAFLPQFIPADSASPITHMLVLGTVFMALTAVVFFLYGLAAHSVSTYIVGSAKARQVMQRGFAASFAALGTKLAFTEN